jgi:hypothetical protein
MAILANISGNQDLALVYLKPCQSERIVSGPASSALKDWIPAFAGMTVSEFTG